MAHDGPEQEDERQPAEGSAQPGRAAASAAAAGAQHPDDHTAGTRADTLAAPSDEDRSPSGRAPLGAVESACDGSGLRPGSAGGPDPLRVLSGSRQALLPASAVDWLSRAGGDQVARSGPSTRPWAGWPPG